MPAALLPDRGIVEVSGEDRLGFLQGLVSGDVRAAAPGLPVWAALLSPQGKWLADFLVLAEAERLLLDLPGADAPLVVERLSRFRLRARVVLADLSAGWTVEAGWDGAPAPTGAAPDPRLPGLGWRRPVPRPGAAGPEGAETDPGYDRHRLALGLPDGARDLDRDRTVLLEAGFDELGGIAWEKGCYMGQELTARTRYRGLVKRRLLPVRIEGEAPARGEAVTWDGREVGEARSSRDGRGLALLRIEAARAPALRAGGAVLRPEVPGWIRLPEAAGAGPG